MKNPNRGQKMIRPVNNAKLFKNIKLFLDGHELIPADGSVVTNKKWRQTLNKPNKKNTK